MRPISAIFILLLLSCANKTDAPVFQLAGFWGITGFNKSIERNVDNPETVYYFTTLVEPNGLKLVGIKFAAEGAFYPTTYGTAGDSIFFENNSFFAGGAKGTFQIKNDTLHLSYTWPGSGNSFDEKLIRQ